MYLRPSICGGVENNIGTLHYSRYRVRLGMYCVQCHYLCSTTQKLMNRAFNIYLYRLYVSCYTKSSGNYSDDLMLTSNTSIFELRRMYIIVMLIESTKRYMCIHVVRLFNSYVRIVMFWL